MGPGSLRSSYFSWVHLPPPCLRLMLTTRLAPRGWTPSSSARGHYFGFQSVIPFLKSNHLTSLSHFSALKPASRLHAPFLAQGNVKWGRDGS